MRRRREMEREDEVMPAYIHTRIGFGVRLIADRGQFWPSDLVLGCAAGFSTIWKQYGHMGWV